MVPMPARRFVLLGLTLSLFLPTALPAPAQEVTVGVRNGVVRSTVQGEVLHQLFLESGPVRKRMQTGFQVAGFVRFPLTDRIGLQAELQYAQKGVALRGEYPTSCGGPRIDCVVPSLDGTYQLSYVQLPVLLGWQRPLGRSVSVRTMIGPSLDVIASTNIKTASLRRSALPENALTPASSAHLGVVGGAALQYTMASGGRVLLSVRYHPAVTRVDVIGSDAAFRSRAYEFGVAYAFRR